MKILWFSGTSSLFDESRYPTSKILGYYGGGWIESLEPLIAETKELELGVSFFHHGKSGKIKQGNTTYYPLNIYNTFLKKLKHVFFYKHHDKYEVNAYLKVINDFKPDIIHIFGSERSFGLITKYTNIPVIIHLQGFLTACMNGYMPPNTNLADVRRHSIASPRKFLSLLLNYSFFRHNFNREKIILKNCRYFLGRTEWDKQLSYLFNPDARYFHCDEVLRPPFYKVNSKKKKDSRKLIIASTTSKFFYKGFDVILKTAKALCETKKLDFEWNVFGFDEYSFWDHKLGIHPEDVCVRLNGIVNVETLINHLSQSDIFVATSYIENSSNSICEAQMVGLPVIATYIGGIPSLIKNEETGILVPANDPFFLASKILELYNNKEKAIYLGNNGRIAALERHNKERIRKELLEIYETIYADRSELQRQKYKPFDIKTMG